jgi:general secretion pathway protein N
MTLPTIGLRWWHAVVFLVVFVAYGVAAAPARWLAPVLASATGGAVRIDDATGSLWQGRGDLVVRVDGGEILLRGTSWKWQPARLAAAELSLRVVFDGPSTRGEAVIARRFSGLTLRDAEIVLPAAALAERHVVLRSWQPSGTFALRTRALEFAAGELIGEAELAWRGAAAAAATLGDYRCVLRAAHGLPAQLELATLKGPLHLAGRGDVAPASGLRLRGTATAEASHREKLWPLLRWLGNDRGDGAVAFDITLPPWGPA